jgi:hypothetical protein
MNTSSDQQVLLRKIHAHEGTLMPSATTYGTIGIRATMLDHIRDLAKARGISARVMHDMILEAGLRSMDLPAPSPAELRCRTFVYGPTGGLDRCELPLGHVGECPPRTRAATRYRDSPSPPSRSSGRRGPRHGPALPPCAWCGGTPLKSSDIVWVGVVISGRQVDRVHRGRCQREVAVAVKQEAA